MHSENLLEVSTGKSSLNLPQPHLNLVTTLTYLLVYLFCLRVSWHSGNVVNATSSVSVYWRFHLLSGVGNHVQQTVGVSSSLGSVTRDLRLVWYTLEEPVESCFEGFYLAAGSISDLSWETVE